MATWQERRAWLREFKRSASGRSRRARPIRFGAKKKAAGGPAVAAGAGIAALRHAGLIASLAAGSTKACTQ
jgi:hypothetical protein